MGHSNLLHNLEVASPAVDGAEHQKSPTLPARGPMSLTRTEPFQNETMSLLVKSVPHPTSEQVGLSGRSNPTAAVRPGPSTYKGCLPLFITLDYHAVDMALLQCSLTQS